MANKIADLVVALDDAPNLDLAIERAMRADTCDVDPEDRGRYLLLESVRVNLYRYTDKTPVISYRFGLYDGDPEPARERGRCERSNDCRMPTKCVLSGKCEFDVPLKEIA